MIMTTETKTETKNKTEKKSIDNLAWAEVRAEILAKVNIESEYLAWGAQPAGTANDEGWIKCHSIGRDDRNPSAGFNIGTGSARGRYRDFAATDDTASLSFFFAAAKFGGFGEPKKAEEHYAALVGVELPKSARHDWSDQIDFRDWADGLAVIYSGIKKPITPEALVRCGARLARWPKKSTLPSSVFSLPVYGPELLNSDPVGWVVIHAGGRMLEVFGGKGQPTSVHKSHSIRGTKGGFINVQAMKHLREATVIWKVEGVTDCLTLESIIPDSLREQHVVVTNSGGCNEKPRADLLENFKGKDVLILHDADKPGQIGAMQWAAFLAERGVTVRNVQLPYTVEDKHGKDLRDWINEGHTYEDLLKLAVATDPVIDPKLANAGNDDFVERAILDQLDLDVLGEHESGAITVYSRYQKKVTTIRDVSRLQLPQLYQICGKPAREYADDRENDEGRHLITEIRKAIALVGGKRRIDEQTMLGNGLWPSGGHAVIVVNGGCASVWNGSRKLEPSLSPLCRGEILDLSNSEPWVDFNVLQKYLDLADDVEFCNQTIVSAANIFARWRWRHQEDDPLLVVGLVMATYLQIFWRWRPQVAILGESGAGKTTLFEFLGHLFGKLKVSGEKPTEAGLRQAISNTAKAVMLDEFEVDKHRQQVLDLIRTSSRGEQSAILRGTADQKGRRFSLRHICWVAAIEVGLKRDPDRNRFIHLELMKPEEENQGRQQIPSPEEAADLGMRLLAVSIETIWRAKEMASNLRTRYDGVPDRVVESYAVPVGMILSASGINPESGRGYMSKLLSKRDFSDVSTSDQQDLIDAILEADVNLGHGNRTTVGRILSGQAMTEDAEKNAAIVNSLEDCGITRVSTGGHTKRDLIPWEVRQIVFIVHKTVAEKLLRNTAWQNQSLDQLLLRTKGAVTSNRKIGGKQSRGVAVPVEIFNLDQGE